MTEQNQVPARSSGVPRWVFSLVVLLALAGALFAASHTQAFKLATTHQPERFTELYFTSPDRLPASTKSGDSLQVSFTLHNEEARSQIYTYAITFTDTSGTTVLKTQRISLQEGQLQAITQDVVVPAGDSRGELSVNLIDKNQTIHFWVERSL